MNFDPFYKRLDRWKDKKIRTLFIIFSRITIVNNKTDKNIYKI